MTRAYGAWTHVKLFQTDTMTHPQIAVNYPARAYGITRHETPAEALKKCPDLMLVHVQTYKNGETVPGYWDGAKPETHKVSLDMYRKESKKILAVFQEFCPLVGAAAFFWRP